jgi:hypothetical protein
MKTKIFFISLFILAMTVLYGGTIIYKSGAKSEEHTLAKVKIISIDKKNLTIEHSGGVRTIPLAYLINYYDSNISSGEFIDNTLDYKLSIRKIEMPKKGYTYKKVKSKKTKKVSDCEIEFTVEKQYEKGKSKSIRMPYFYLFVLTTATESYGRRPVFSYYYPKEAKVKAETYDKAKIIEVVTAMKRPRIYNGNRSYLGKAGKLSPASGYRPITISLKRIKGQTIIAYHLEVWGKNKIIATKDWKEIRASVGKNWWKRY